MVSSKRKYWVCLLFGFALMIVGFHTDSDLAIVFGAMATGIGAAYIDLVRTKRLLRANQ